MRAIALTGVSPRGRGPAARECDSEPQPPVLTSHVGADLHGHEPCSHRGPCLRHAPPRRPTSAASPSTPCSTEPSRPTFRASWPTRPGTPRPPGCPPSSSVSSSGIFGVESWPTGRSSHTRYDHFFPPTPPHVTITRRHHPLQGHTFEVVRGGPRELVIRTVDGVVMRVPRAWTDADGETSTAAGPDAVFTVEAIRVLVALVEALRGPWKH
jgi:Family of unknown function (DUF5372)